MNWKWNGARILGCVAVLLSLHVQAENTAAQSNRSASKTNTEALPSGIAWYGVLTDGIAEAKATNRPILLLSAAPQCGGVPGMW